MADLSPALDPLIHAPVRLRIMSALLPVDSMSFNVLKENTGTTDGNLATHARKLEDAGYIAVEKHFAGRKPVTTFRMTEVGRQAFAGYVGALQALLPRP